MVLDGTTPNEDSMVSGKDGQAFTSPQIVDPKRMNKLLRYLLRRGMYTSVIPSVLYRALLVMREYNSASEWGRRQTFHRQVQADLVVCTFQDCVDNNEGKVSLSIPLWRWVQKLYGKEARALRSLDAAQKPEILGLLFVFSIFIDLFVIFASFPIYIISGLVGNLSATLRAARSVQALIAILIVVFITDDAWRVFGLESTLRLSIMIVMLVAISVLVLVTGLRKWMAQDSWLGVVGYSVDGGEKILAKWAESAPALAFFVPRVRPVLPIDDGDGGDSNDLRKSLESNVTILLFIAIIASAIAIAFWISLAFIAVGIVAVTKPMTEELTGGRISVIWQLDLLGQSFIFTRQLLFLSIMLGGIAALTFSAAAVQDAFSRSALREYALTDVRHAVSGYAYYMGAIYNVANQLVTDGVWDELQKVDKMALKKRLGSIFEPM